MQQQTWHNLPFDMDTMYDGNYYNGNEGKSNYHGYEDDNRFGLHYNAIKSLFNPTSVLEVGCARGFVIKLLNDNGIYSVGVDTSTWAVSKRVHENVIRCNVANGLPFKDNEFDLVCSFDFLEHIPEVCVQFVVDEIKRVGKRSYHSIYEKRGGGDTDVTHVTLKPMDWWIEKFGIDKSKRCNENTTYLCWEE